MNEDEPVDEVQSEEGKEESEELAPDQLHHRAFPLEKKVPEPHTSPGRVQVFVSINILLRLICDILISFKSHHI